MFFAFDGLDGVGKTTQLDLFCQWLGAAGHDVVRLIDPGSTPLGEKIRGLLLQKAGSRIDPMSEMLLFMAARAEMVSEVIEPALAAGRVIVSDRYLLANVVYQGYGRGLDVETIWNIGQVATAGISPDLTVVLDMPIDAAVARLSRPLDRMELDQDAEFRQRLRRGFLTEAERQPDKIFVVDSSKPIEAVQAEIRRRCLPILAADRKPQADAKHLPIDRG